MDQAALSGRRTPLALLCAALRCAAEVEVEKLGLEQRIPNVKVEAIHPLSKAMSEGYIRKASLCHHGRMIVAMTA
jgi:hypothetical protein